MTVNKSRHEIVIQSEECYTIAYSIFYALENAVKTHWIKHPKKWETDGEKERIALMKFFFELANYSYLFDDRMETLRNIIKDHQEAKTILQK